MTLTNDKIKFNENGHTYTWLPTGKLIPGATKVIAGGSKTFLQAWYAKEVVKELGYFDKKIQKDGKWISLPTEEVENNMQVLTEKKEAIAKMTPEEYWNMLHNAKGAAPRKAKEATTSGSLAHLWIEVHIKEQLGEKMDIPDLSTDPKAKNAVEAFLQWEKKYKPQWIASELVAGTPDFGCTIDALMELDGKLIINDFKTNSQVSEDVFLQTAANYIALSEVGVCADDRTCLRLDKETGEYEFVRVPTPLDFDMEVFNALLTFHRWGVYVDGLKEHDHLLTNKMTYERNQRKTV
jgi:hypothetical protein